MAAATHFVQQFGFQVRTAECVAAARQGTRCCTLSFQQLCNQAKPPILWLASAAC